MKSWKITVVIIVVWILVGIVSSWRIFSQGGFPAGEAGFIRQLIVGLPGWVLWAAATPVIYWLGGKLPLTTLRTTRNITLLLISGVLFLFTYIALFLLFENFLGVSLNFSESFILRYQNYLKAHYLTILLLYFAVLALFYIFRALDPSGRSSEGFRNSILVKTRYGYVLVEIIRFQYVRNAKKRVLFHTGRRRHMTREMVEIDPTTIVEEKKYDPERKIVINLGNIRRAVRVGEGDYHFYIGYSHQLILDSKLFNLLKAWLPTPDPREKAEYF